MKAYERPPIPANQTRRSEKAPAAAVVPRSVGGASTMYPHRLASFGLDGAPPIQRVANAQTPINSRVVITNQSEPFYLAVGTVKGLGGANSTLSVEFEMKPGSPYDVPYGDMDLYVSDSVYYRDVLESGNATINGVPSLVQFMGEHYEGAWAFSGSVAIKYWAQRYGVQFREPNDMDIVVSDLHSAWFSIASGTGASTSRPPGPRTDHKTIDLGMFKLDILASGGGLGDLRDGVTPIFGVPVVSPATLRKFKEQQDSEHADIAVINQIIARIGGPSTSSGSQRGPFDEFSL